MQKRKIGAVLGEVDRDRSADSAACAGD